MSARGERNIPELSDVLGRHGHHNDVVEIQIWLEDREPPTGLVGLPEREAVPFEGWLGLLRALSELFAVRVG